MGALMGTFVERVVKPTETIRSAEIQDASSLKELVRTRWRLILTSTIPLKIGNVMETV